MTMTVYAKLNSIQKELNAPKGQRNNFGNYNYRSCEDILSAVKPLLGDDLVLILSDSIELVSDRIYVKATAKLTDGKNTVENTAFAREQFSKKGMDESQITGSASSYARKYALNGMFAIDDTKDADTNAPDDNEKEWLNLDLHDGVYDKISDYMAGGKTADWVIKGLRNKYKVNKETEKQVRSMWQ